MNKCITNDELNHMDSVHLESDVQDSVNCAFLIFPMYFLGIMNKEFQQNHFEEQFELFRSKN
mgnify:FL=1|tara:strand:- start:605 stop:790 length:186 start_codon:yes stop_codon:yes gene_type:complete